jgi:hypothetical protein
MVTLAPPAARSLAVTSPKPRDPPMTRACWPANSPGVTNRCASARDAWACAGGRTKACSVPAAAPPTTARSTRANRSSTAVTRYCSSSPSARGARLRCRAREDGVEAGADHADQPGGGQQIEDETQREVPAPRPETWIGPTRYPPPSGTPPTRPARFASDRSAGGASEETGPGQGGAAPSGAPAQASLADRITRAPRPGL